jgi:glycine C-acetyltransferase
MQGLLRKGDVLILDEKCHKSLIDGGTLSGAKMLFFQHNDPASLEAMLQKSKGKRALVAFEGVYSMDGDLVRLPEILEVCKQHKAATYIDEAPPRCLGQRAGWRALRVGHEIGMSFGTLSKSFGGVGGFVCSNAASSATSRAIPRRGTSPAPSPGGGRP